MRAIFLITVLALWLTGCNQQLASAPPQQNYTPAPVQLPANATSCTMPLPGHLECSCRRNYDWCATGQSCVRRGNSCGN